MLLAIAIAMLALVACSSAGSPQAAGSPSATSTAAAPSPTAPGVSRSLPLEVAPTEAAALRDAGAFVLDVRQPDEWAEGHIPGATLIPLDDLPARLAEVPRDHDIVVVCRSGNRSAAARDYLLETGYRAVTSVAGGMRAWAAAGLDVEAGT